MQVKTETSTAGIGLNVESIAADWTKWGQYVNVKSFIE